jgi:hypothetical protein
VLTAHEAAKRDAERCGEQRQDTFVHPLSGFEALDRARQHAGPFHRLRREDEAPAGI